MLAGSLAGCAGDAGSPGDPADRATDGRTRSPDQTVVPRTGTIAEPTPTEPPVETRSPPPETTRGNGARTTVTLELDLREANVMAVTVERHDGDVSFDVTLYHDDDGESGYANWWQVETLGGDRIGRRDLLHAHGTREFTRSDRFAVPTETAWVVVRGHDQTHGYGGRAMLVNLESGETRVAFQGAEPQSFADFAG